MTAPVPLARVYRLAWPGGTCTWYAPAACTLDEARALVAVGPLGYLRPAVTPQTTTTPET